MTTTREAAMEAALKVVAAILQAEKGRMGGKPCTGEWSIPALGIRSTVSAALDMARAALSTPATEPQGYVEGLERAIKAARHSLVEFCGYPEASIMVEGLDRALAARPAPQPAADTRVVVKPLVWVPEDAPCTRFKAEALGGHMMIVELDPKTDPGKYSVGFDLGGLCFKFVLAEYDDFPPKYTAPAKFDGIEAAKAAAQADYETRIMSAIIGTATPAPSDKIAEAAQVIIAKWDADTKTGLVYGPNEFAVMLRALAGKGE